MWIHADFLPIIDNLTVDEGDQFVIVDDLGVLSLRQHDRFSGPCGNIFPEHIFPRYPRGFRNAHGKHVADLRANKDIHILIVHAVKGTLGRPPLGSHIEFLFDAGIRPRFGLRSACRHKRGQTRDTALNRILVNAVDDLLRRKCVHHIGNLGRHIALFLIKTHGGGHCVACDLNGKGNDRIVFHLFVRTGI